MSTIDTYPAEYFQKAARTPDMIQLDKDALLAREEFLDRFGPEQLKALSGKELLYQMFNNSMKAKETLCYTLENAKNLIIFGGIGGGSSYKFGLFLHHQSCTWRTGSPNKPITLSEMDAVSLATEIRDSLVEGADVIAAAETPKSREDYELLYQKLSHIKGINNVWVQKYYEILYPDLFSVYYSKSFQCGVLEFLKQEPSDIPFVRMGQIALAMKEMQLHSWIFAQIYYQLPTIDPATPPGIDSDDTKEPHYWLYSPGANACFWEQFYKDGIMAIGWSRMGPLTDYKTRNEMRDKMQELYGADNTYRNSTLATWQFLTEIKPGDIILAKKGRNEIVGRGIVIGDYEYRKEGTEDYNHCRKVKWTDQGSWHTDENMHQKVLTDITVYTESVEYLKSLFETDIETLPTENEPYTADTFLEQVYMDPDDYHELVALLRKKKNIILQGAPGVGKTYAAKRLAYSMMGEIDKSRVMMVQFHQSYSYEDFIMGYRPVNNSFEIKKGAFYNFCKEAEENKDQDYFFIIDEINRGNISKIFGELFMLIETDKRGQYLQLLYSDELFTVPENVYIIGMMNTADRSLAMLDYALRRRFAFFDMKPGFETDGFQNYQDSLDSDCFNNLISTVCSLNQQIADDDTLGEGFCIGHSYFCNLKQDEVDSQVLRSIVNYELIPLLKEYWFDEPQKVKDWSNRLRSAVQ